MGAARDRVKRARALNIKAELQALRREQGTLVARVAQDPKGVANMPIAAIRGVRVTTLAAEGPSSLRWIS
jgi:hypothetical protein